MAEVNDKLSWWQQWLQQPQRLKLHSFVFQLHFWVGSIAGMYVTLISVTGSILVYGNEPDGLLSGGSLDCIRTSSSDRLAAW